MNNYWIIPSNEVRHESSEHHGAASEQNPLIKLDPGLFIWTIITFLLLLTILKKFAWKPLLEILDERQKSIEDSLDAAEKARQELENINKESDAIERELILKQLLFLRQDVNDLKQLFAAKMGNSENNIQPTNNSLFVAYSISYNIELILPTNYNVYFFNYKNKKLDNALKIERKTDLKLNN